MREARDRCRRRYGHPEKQSGLCEPDRLCNYEYDGEEQEYTIAPDEIFVLGDNTKVSLDSRMFGPVKTDQLLFQRISFGKAV